MGADPTAFANMYAFLAKDFDKQDEKVQEERKRIARFIYKMTETDGSSCFDFSDGDLDCYDELGVLGLAKRCKTCQGWFTKQTKDDHGKDLCEVDETGF